ncbi:MAG: VWA domain-containing protein [bacterium]|nr:VWA domain-containing protein [bacterium]
MSRRRPAAARRWAWALPALAIVTILAGPRAAEPADEHVEVRLVRLPVLLQERAGPGSCDGLGADRIEVVEDGLAVPAEHLEPKRLDAVHAILLDTSQSMLDSLQEARRAARKYVASLPPEEPALLATFDDSLLLHAPMSTDRGMFNDRLDWIETAWETNYWDATLQTIDYLGSRPERKVLVTITDGCDSGRPEAPATESVIERAVRTESLIVFPVGLALPVSCGRELRDNPADPLKRLAAATGGEFHSIDSAEDLRSVLPAIRDRMERERYVTYRPVPFGDGPKDHPAQHDRRRRNVDVRWTDKKLKRRCRISLAGSRVRFEGRSDLRADGDAAVAFRRDERSTGVFRGRMRDIVEDSGPLADPEELRVMGDYGSARNSPRRILAERDVATWAPPFEEVVRPDARPWSAFLQLIEALVGDPTAIGTDSIVESWKQVPLLVNGRSLLPARRGLSAALYEMPGYREWVRDKVRVARIAAVEDVVRRVRDPEEFRADEVAAILRQGDWDPTTSELETYLGDWLGDLKTRDLYAMVERRFARRAIDIGRRSGDFATAIAGAESVWPRLGVLFPPPADVRVLALLVPGYDSRRDVVGFHRVILPRPESLFQTRHFSADAPLGVRLVGWLLGNEATSRPLRSLTLEAVVYPDTQALSIRPKLERLELIERDPGLSPILARRVRIVLSSREDPQLHFPLTADFRVKEGARDDYEDTPACVTITRDPSVARVATPLVAGLVRVMRDAELPCILQTEPSRDQ